MRVSMAGRQPSVNREAMKVPSPAAYNVKPIGKARVCKFGTGSGRKSEIRSFVPGPGQYDIKTQYLSFKKSAPSWK